MENGNNQKNSGQINLVDIFFYLLNHWYWFVLCIGLAVAFTSYRYAKTPFSYRSNATIIIKNPSNTRATTKLDNYSNLINSVSMSNEMLQLKSKTLMAEVVKDLNIDVNYIHHVGLRNIELYRNAPIRIFFSREDNPIGYFTIKATPRDSKTIELDLSSLGQKNVVVSYGDKVKIGDGSFTIDKTRNLGKHWFGEAIYIQKIPVSQAAAAYSSALNISQNNSAETVLNLSIQDFSLQRANDILTAIVYRYNEEAVKEKNKVAVNTAEFIDSRIKIIRKELSDVEDMMSGYRSTKKLLDANADAAEYLSESRSYGSDISQVETNLSIAEYLRDYVRGSMDSFEVIPANTGLNDANLDQAISQYNDLVIKRDRLEKASSSVSPAVMQIEDAMISMKQNILGTIDNLMTSLNVQKRDLLRQEATAMEKFTEMPEKAIEMRQMERQLSIKEDLYIYLLNKREENELSQAMVDDNAIMFDSAEGSPVPVYPSRQRMMLLAVLMGLLVPAVVMLFKMFLDNKVYSRKDVEEIVKVPFIAEIPMKK
ncbi:MAG: chromosome partitioning protein ParA, partial [Bacteroidales bacterium]|nr:chromosome partitioning protein ParA [Bacteroidales bacterium]